MMVVMDNCELIYRLGMGTGMDVDCVIGSFRIRTNGMAMLMNMCSMRYLRLVRVAADDGKSGFDLSWRILKYMV